jgi:hypothetical protein
MARTFTVIQTAMKADIRTNYPSLNGFLFPEEGGSKVGVFNSLISVFSLAIYTFEVILDTTQAAIQTIANSAPSGNPAWVQRQILNFQYGDVVTLTNFVPGYAVINLANRIVTQCAVSQQGSGVINIKVAKGVSPALTPLSAPELAALKDYYTGTTTTQGIGFAGVAANFVNLNPDRLYVEATIYFYGQYLQATVSSAVIVAINNFLSTFQGTSFGGVVYMIRMTDAIQAVPGVSRVVYTSIKGRDAATALGSATPIDFQAYYSTAAGYLISEDTAANTLSDKLTFLQEV